MSDLPLAIMPEPHTNLPRNDVDLRKLIYGLGNEKLGEMLNEMGFAEFEGNTRQVWESKLISAIKDDRDAWKKDFGKFTNAPKVKEVKEVKVVVQKEITQPVESNKPAKINWTKPAGKDSYNLKNAVASIGFEAEAGAREGRQIVGWTFTRGTVSRYVDRDTLNSMSTRELVDSLK